AATGAVAPVAPRGPAPKGADAGPDWVRRAETRPARAGGPAWSGVNILEFGSGAAGPIATRYFAEHGATVLRVESRTRPDFLRVYALGPNNPHRLAGSPL